jgi:hypothetical protein
MVGEDNVILKDVPIVNIEKRTKIRILCIFLGWNRRSCGTAGCKDDLFQTPLVTAIALKDDDVAYGADIKKCQTNARWSGNEAIDRADKKYLHIEE